MLTWVAWGLLALIWGTTWIAIRVGLEVVPPLTYAGIRFLVGALVLGGVIAIRGVALPRRTREWRLVLSTGFQIFALGYALQFWGMQYVPSGLSAVVFAVVPLLTMFLAHFRLGDERITAQKTLGSVVAVAGVVLISREQLHADSHLAFWGVLAFVVASMIYANAQVTLKNAGGTVDPLVMATFQMIAGGTLLLVLGVTLEGDPRVLDWSMRSLTALLYLSVIGSSLAFFLFYWILRRMQVTKLMTVLLVDPIIALLLGYAFLAESVEPGELVGSVLTLAGLALVLTARGRSGPATA